MSKLFVILAGVVYFALPCFGTDFRFGPDSIRYFENYGEVFRFIAEIEKLPQDSNSLIKLAAESDVEDCFSQKHGTFTVIGPQFMDEWQIQQEREL